VRAPNDGERDVGPAPRAQRENLAGSGERSKAARLLQSNEEKDGKDSSQLPVACVAMAKALDNQDSERYCRDVDSPHTDEGHRREPYSDRGEEIEGPEAGSMSALACYRELTIVVTESVTLRAIETGDISP
jgi:hypothetical protein